MNRPAHCPPTQQFASTFDVADPDFPTPLGVPHRVIFDSAATSETPDGRSSRFEPVARFLNMHVTARVKPALSAMTTMVSRQNQGYAPVPW